MRIVVRATSNIRLYCDDSKDKSATPLEAIELLGSVTLGEKYDAKITVTQLQPSGGPCTPDHMRTLATFWQGAAEEVDKMLVGLKAE